MICALQADGRRDRTTPVKAPEMRAFHVPARRVAAIVRWRPRAKVIAVAPRRDSATFADGPALPFSRRGGVPRSQCRRAAVSVTFQPTSSMLSWISSPRCGGFGMAPTRSLLLSFMARRSLTIGDRRSGPHPRPRRPRSGTPRVRCPIRARPTGPPGVPSADADGSRVRPRYPDAPEPRLPSGAAGRRRPGSDVARAGNRIAANFGFG